LVLTIAGQWIAASLVATVLCLTTVAVGDETRVEAKPAVKLTIIPTTPSIAKPSTTPCPGYLCGLDDVWKRDVFKHERSPAMDSSSVVIDRAQFEQEVARFGDPHAPVVLDYKFPGLGLCLGGYAVGGGLGIRSC
jgi:hypothetical protein